MATFTAPALKTKPQLICVGRITDVGEAKVGKSGKYYVVPVGIEALDAGKNQKVYWLFRPEWLTIMSKTELNRLAEEDKGAYFVYGNNLASQEEDQTPVLYSLAGSQEAYAELCDRLINLGVAAVEENPALVSDTLRTFLVEENGDRLIGYVLRQQTQKTGEVDDQGKAIYEPTKFMEVASYFDPSNEKVMKRMVAKAEQNPNKFKLTYTGCAF